MNKYEPNMAASKMMDELLEAETTVWNMMEALKHQNKCPEVYEALADAKNGLETAFFRLQRICRNAED